MPRVRGDCLLLSVAVLLVLAVPAGAATHDWFTEDYGNRWP